LVSLIRDLLVGGINTTGKNMKVSWDDDIPNTWKNKKYVKPPTSICKVGILSGILSTWKLENRHDHR